jgi:hypothetical protein
MVTLELPAIGLASRPDVERLYKVDPLTYPSRWLAQTHQNLHLAHPGNLFAPTLSVSLARYRRGHWTLAGLARVRYRYTPYPRSLRVLEESAALEVSRGW